MDLSILNHSEFLKLAKHQKQYSDIIAKEWRVRFEIEFPYYLLTNGEIYNYLVGQVVKDDVCDKLIKEQADKLRENNKV